MEKRFQEFEKRINEYFSETSDEQLRLDLEDAGYEIYKNVTIQIFGDYVSSEKFSIPLKGSKWIPDQGHSQLVFKDIFTPDNYPFDFRIAA